MPTVSLIVPVFKAEPWIWQCMSSIYAQTYKGIELIVIDDAEGMGAAAARNRGLEKATGEFIAFCDVDDYMEPNAIANLVAAIDGADMVCGSFRKFGDFEMIVTTPTRVLSIKDVAEYVMGNLRNPRSNQMLSGCWAKLYRRELIDKFPLLTTAEDMAFNFDYLTRCKNVRFIDDIVYHNRKRDGSLTTTFDAKDKDGLFGVIKALKYVEKFLDCAGVPVDGEIDSSKMYHSMLYFMRICEHTGLPMNEVFKKLYP